MSADPSKSKIVAPTHCQTMAEVRAGVDDADRALVALLQTRFGYMDAAARIKPTRDAVRDEGRKAQVIANVRAEAVARRLPEELLTQIWDVLVEGSIAYELERWDKTRG
jgi:isochorismate pyruvate lyase